MRSTARHPPSSRAELEMVVREYRHLLEEHRRAHAEGRVRRHMEIGLHALELKFEHLLEEWMPDEELRAAWRGHFHGRAPEPAQPAGERRLLFRGRAETDSILEIRERRDGIYDVLLDGRLVERLMSEDEPLGKGMTGVFTLDHVDFREVFFVSEPALAALADFVAGREPHPPWRFAAELVSDGLIDRNFGLTARGHRALAARLRR